jgi:L-threonylcarbamoyladenylate synthase
MADTIRNAALALKAGHLVAFPTETVYGLGGDARNPDSVKRIYEVKGRPIDHPLIVHISSIIQLDKWAIDIPDYAIKLAEKFWPGPMTLILKRSEIVGDFITGGQDTVGLRVPSDAIALALINEFERISESAIAAPSANRFGHTSSTCSADVWEELGEYLNAADQIIDGGNSTIGIESTIVDCTGKSPAILRSGAISEEDINSELGITSNKNRSSFDIKFSGSFERHYAPICKVIVNGPGVQGAGFLALSNIETPSGLVRLASPKTIEEFAQILYSTFRRADRANLPALIVVAPSGQGLAVAIEDRLSKASRGR